MEIETEKDIGDLLNESKNEEIRENLTLQEEEAPEDMEGELSVNDKLKLITSDDESKLDDSFDDGTVEEETVLTKEENKLSPRGFKRKPEDELSSDEEFAGFDDADDSPSKNHRSKKLKESIIVEFENRNESAVQLKEKKIHTRPVPLTDPIFLEPFKYGWKREMVLRATPGVSKEKGEIYYITPTGKRLRTRNEIALNLHDDLTLTNFTLIKEALGADPDFEIIRSAKNINSKRSSIEPIHSNLTPVIGKRIPKPKAPKGVSPPPYKGSGKINRMLNTPVSRKDVENEVKTIGLGGKLGKGTKPKPDNCTIQCLLAMGTIPQLQCKKCLCLYHHECVGFDKLDGPIANYICEGCIEELAILHVQQTLPVPPLPVADVPAPITPRPSITAAMKPDNPPIKLQQPREGNVVGSMTTWLPPTSNISTNRSGLNKIENPPQTIAVLKGRKFIVVPKMNLLSVSPLGETKNNVERGAGGRMKLLLSDGGHHKTGSDDRNNEASQLTPSTTNSQSNAVEPTTITGKRTKSRGNSIAASSVTSPQHSSDTSPNLTYNNSKVSTNNLNSTGKNKKGVSTVLCNHVNFSANFFSNVSVGYDVLLQTFQLLNVQELLRASCVCRMWNQVANHSSLWKTVRMKNSLVNDWSGLASTLKRNGTKNLDLRKMLISGKPEEMWLSFRKSIGSVVDLESIDFCKCSTSVIESLFQTNFNLKILNAVTLTDDDLNLTNLSNLSKLTELRLKSSNGLFIKDLSDLEDLRDLRHLSLTGVADIGQKNIEVLAAFENLESLELGECSDLPKSFAKFVLPALNKLERLRLEKGQVSCCTFEILTQIAEMNNLHQLELINFDINNGFNTYLSKCKFLKKILLIPTYVSQSATTNQMVLSSVLPLAKSLTLFTWVVTLELLRVTELYVDKCDGSKKDKNPLSDCIPILKPVPGNMEISQKSDLSKKSTTEQQVEILPLQMVEKILTDGLPNTKVQMLRISYLSTWKQNLVDSLQ